MKKIILILVLTISSASLSAQVVIAGGSYTAPVATLEGNLLKISGSPDIDLSGYLDNTDAQTITDFSISGSLLSITLSNGNTKTLDLAGISGGDGLGVDGDVGDITIGGSGTTATINNAAITSSKIGEGEVSGLNIEDGTITENDISSSNSGSLGYSLTSDGSGGFTWVDKTTSVQSNVSEIADSDQIINFISATQSEILSNPTASTTVVLCTDCPPATIVISATIDLDSKDIQYDDQTADAGTITFNNAKAGATAYIYINRATAPTLAGTGLTFNNVTGSAAFAASTDMVMCFQVRYDGTTVDYYYLEL